MDEYALFLALYMKIILKLAISSLTYFHGFPKMCETLSGKKFVIYSNYFFTMYKGSVKLYMLNFWEAALNLILWTVEKANYGVLISWKLYTLNVMDSCW